MLERGILGSGRTGSVSSRPFLNSSGWWWLISSVFLIRISCHKTTHANDYYGAWPGWAVSVSVLPLTQLYQYIVNLSLPYPLKNSSCYLCHLVCILVSSVQFGPFLYALRHSRVIRMEIFSSLCLKESLWVWNRSKKQIYNWTEVFLA